MQNVCDAPPLLDLNLPLTLLILPIADNIDNDGVDTSCQVDLVKKQFYLMTINYSDDAGESIDFVGDLVINSVAPLWSIIAYTWRRKRRGTRSLVTDGFKPGISFKILFGSPF